MATALLGMKRRQGSALADLFNCQPSDAAGTRFGVNIENTVEIVAREISRGISEKLRDTFDGATKLRAS
jgi:hypothetical protein